MSVAVANPYRYRQTIGMFVEFGRGMSNPYDVAPTGDGRLFVLSRSNIFDAPVGGLRIGIMTLDEDYLGEWGAYGTGPGQLVWPNSMVLDAHGRLLISDEWRHDVQCFDQDGTLDPQLGRSRHRGRPLQPCRRPGLRLRRERHRGRCRQPSPAKVRPTRATS